MEKIEKEVSQWLTDFLGKLTGVELTELERHAAFQLLCTLPDSACLKDFVLAATPAKVKEAGLPDSVAQCLVAVVTRLEPHLSSNGRSSLFETTQAVIVDEYYMVKEHQAYTAWVKQTRDAISE